LIPTDRNAPPPNWTSGSLGQLASLITKGSTPTTYGHNYKSAGIPFIRVENLADGYIDGSSVTMFIDEAADETLRRSRLCSEDVLISIAGTIGRIALVRDENVPANINQALALIRGTDRVLTPLFLMYFLRSSAAHQRALKDARGGAMNNISLGDVARLDVPIPPIHEQQRIVEEIEKQFTRLEAGVVALKLVQANLKRYRAAVLKAAVEGRLVPTEAELARREGRSYEPASELLARIVTQPLLAVSKKAQAGVPVPPKAKSKEPFAPDTANLAVLPEGWTSATIGQLIVEPLCNGISVKGNDSPPGIAALKLHAMSDRGFDYSIVRYLPLAENSADDLWVREGDFFVSRGNGSLKLVGRGTSAQNPPAKIIFPDTMIRLRVVPELRKANWIPTIWPSRFFRRQVEQRVKTTAGIYKISQPQLRSVAIPLPPLAEQRRIVAEAERRLSVIDELEMQVESNLKRAERLRQAILKRAFEGKLVPQDPNDEPASMLLERIRAERETVGAPLVGARNWGRLGPRAGTRPAPTARSGRNRPRPGT